MSNFKKWFAARARNPDKITLEEAFEAGARSQPAPRVPEDVMRDAERYRYLRARDDGTAGVGCWIEADGRVCDRGWLYGVQLDSAIDSFIEVLAVAPQPKAQGTDPNPGDLLTWSSQAVLDVAAERRRQIESEGWTPEHDDKREGGDMARAAACYALHAAGYRGDDTAMLRFWPWLDAWWKPGDQRRDLVKAGALILAEIERLDRAAAAPKPEAKP